MWQSFHVSGPQTTPHSSAHGPGTSALKQQHIVGWSVALVVELLSVSSAPRSGSHEIEYLFMGR
jgi:hypothetical protein